MTRPTAPPDPSSTFTDDDAEESKTGEMSPIPTDTTAAILAPVPATDATFVELPPTPPKEKPGPPVPSDIALPPVADPTVVSAATQPKLGPATTLTVDSDPDPKAIFRYFLIAPRYRAQRLMAGTGLAFLFVAFGLYLGSGRAPRLEAVPIRKVARPEPPDAPKPEPAPEIPQALRPATPMYVEVEVDGGVEKVEAGMIKIASMPETEVTANGRKLGPTPVFVTAPAGRVELVLESRDAGIYKPVVLQLLPGKNPGRMWDLGRGWLEIVAPHGSQISVDGRGLGTAPVAQVELWEGFHRVEVVRPDKVRLSKSVEVVPRFTTTHEFPNQ